MVLFFREREGERSMLKGQQIERRFQDLHCAFIMGRILCSVIPVSGLFVSSATFVEGNQDCSCFQMDIGAVIGIITCDIFLTLLIAISVYCFVSHQKRRCSLHAQTRCCGSSKATTYQSSVKPKMPEVESPYQELYGVQSDIYSDLQQYRK